MRCRPRMSNQGSLTALGCALLIAACSSGSEGGSGGKSGGTGGAPSQSGSGGSGTNGSSGGTTGSGGSIPGTGTGGTGGQSAGSGGQSAGSGGQSAGSGGQSAGTGGTGGDHAGAGGKAGAAGPAGQAGQGGRASNGGSGQAGGGPGANGGSTGSCVGAAWPTADPTTMGPFAVTADKNVGPLAGVVPDPVYGDVQQRFNVYRPKDLAQGGYCHPILVWANGHTDNPEPNPPQCVSSKYCGSYLMLMQQMASHGFVVIASLSTITSQGTPVPTLVGLDWLLQQADDPASPYYHRLDTAHIGAFGHSEGGASTCIAASDPRIGAIATVSGTRANDKFHQPALFFCGGKDTTVPCDGVQKVYASVTTQPAMFVDNLAADHGGWLYQSGAKGPDIFGLTAWFRVHLMGDTANRKYFYGANCTFCSDTRVQVMRNMYLTQ